MKIYKQLILSIAFVGLLFSAQVFAQEAQVLSVSKKVVAALKNKDMKTLAAYVHPTKGVRFSPYGYVEAKSDLVFKRAQIPNLFSLRRTYVWGAYDGSGDAINLGFPAYYAKFVYDKDFARAPQIAYNEKIAASNTIVNIKKAYPAAKFVEYHFPATSESGGIDWRSLRLIFERAGKRWHLVGISHDEWTV